MLSMDVADWQEQPEQTEDSGSNALSVCKTTFLLGHRARQHHPNVEWNGNDMCYFQNFNVFQISF